MRKALNENPVVQISVLGVGLILVGFLLFTRMSGGKEKEPVPPNAPIGSTAASATAPPGATAPATAPGATSGAVDPAVTPPVGGATGSSTPPIAGSVDPEAWSEPGP